MSNFMIAFLASVGISTWIYSKMYSRTGGNTQTAITVCAISGLGIFLFLLLVLQFISSILE